jgi:ubiquinone/menaquinone biosynthesis C-methylase UbiE
MAAVQATVQSCPFIDNIFDAAVAWGIMFHLNPEDQIRAIANVSRVLKPGAPFLFTSGDEAKTLQKSGKSRYKKPLVIYVQPIWDGQRDCSK